MDETATKLIAALKKMPALITRDVCEYPDSDSPDEDPEAVTIKAKDLTEVVQKNVEVAFEAAGLHWSGVETGPEPKIPLGDGVGDGYGDEDGP